MEGDIADAKQEIAVDLEECVVAGDQVEEPNSTKLTSGAAKLTPRSHKGKVVLNQSTGAQSEKIIKTNGAIKIQGLKHKSCIRTEGVNQKSLQIPAWRMKNLNM